MLTTHSSGVNIQIRALGFFRLRAANMGRVEWLKWMMTYRRPKTRAQQIGRFFIFELYYQLCKLRGYKVEHILKIKPLPAGKYILVWPPLPVSIRLLDEIFPFGRDAHA